MPAEFKSCKDHQYRDPETNRCRNKPDYKRVRSAKQSKSRKSPGLKTGLKTGLKPCKDHQYRDHVTNRCRNKPDYKRIRASPSKVSKSRRVSTGATYKPCKDHQYRDPVTNRCMNKPDYKRVRSSPTKASKSTYKPCKDHQHRDPDTNRCVNNEKRKAAKRTPPEEKRVIPSTERWEYTKQIISDCIKRSKLPLRDLQVKVVQYMDTHDSILVMHGTGTGKTLTAITTSQCYLDQHPDRKVVFVGPASLASNFQKELVRYGLENYNKYEFYSFDKFYLEDKAKRPINLKNKMLIVDEAHNLRNPKSLKSQAVVRAATVADKRMLLTATPFVNNLEDFIPLINMLYGRQIVGTRTQFYDGDVDEWVTKKSTPHNLSTIRYLMKDKVDVVIIKGDNPDFPERIEHTRDVPMTDEYYERYSRIVSGENIYGILFNNPEAFYNGYRRAVNKAGPGYYSMKINNALPVLKKGKSVIYTNWIEFGIGPITDALKENKISYRVFSGEIDIADRQGIVNDFNKDKFQVLVLTKAGGEGLDLKGVQSVVVVDPTWNDAGLQQIIGRAIRYKSHAHLPKAQQKVDVYFMVLTAPEKIAKSQTQPSGDALLYGIIAAKNELNAAIITILEDMSI